MSPEMRPDLDNTGVKNPQAKGPQPVRYAKTTVRTCRMRIAGCARGSDVPDVPAKSLNSEKLTG